MAVAKIAGPIGLAISIAQKIGASAGLRKRKNLSPVVAVSEPLQKRACSMDTAPKEIKDYVRPLVFVYHKHALSGRPYGVLCYTRDLPGPDTKNLEASRRYDITDENWSNFLALVEIGRAPTLIQFLTQIYPPPVDPIEMPLTAVKAVVIEEMSSHSTEVQPS